jgi:hypothetical protein
LQKYLHGGIVRLANVLRKHLVKSETRKNTRNNIGVSAPIINKGAPLFPGAGGCVFFCSQFSVLSFLLTAGVEVSDVIPVSHA